MKNALYTYLVIEWEKQEDGQVFAKVVVREFDEAGQPVHRELEDYQYLRLPSKVRELNALCDGPPRGCQSFTIYSPEQADKFISWIKETR